MLQHIYRSLVSRLSNSTKQNVRVRNAVRKVNRLSFQSLEQRNLLAGIFFDSATGILTVAGSSGQDTGQLVFQGDGNVEASLNGVPDQSFSISEVEQLVFIGFGGDDSFENSTSIPSRLLGGDGNDTLQGGSAEDIINGGRGDDILQGMESADRIIGSSGDDMIFGGEGGDRLFGTSGANVIEGGTGDDLIFGGDDSDRIFGQDGIDSIFGLGGDDFLDAGDGGVAGTPGVEQADLILGHGGNDEIVGGDGLNVLYGGDGDDRFIGGDGENRIHGQNGNDIISGGDSDDFIAGGLGNDKIFGGDGNDYIIPGFGDDVVWAGGGTDFVVFSRQFSDYSVSTDGETFNIELPAALGADGLDEIGSVEGFRFAGENVSLEQVLEEVDAVVTIRPIVLSNSDGTNTAEFFGNAEEEAAIKERINEIYAQARIEIRWEEASSFNDTESNIGNGRDRSSQDIHDISHAAWRAGLTGVGLEIYFVEIAPGHRDRGESRINTASLPSLSSSAIHVGDRLPGTESGRDYIARAVAHAIGHNLGLGDSDNENNLMFNERQDDAVDLSPAQIQIIRESLIS